MMYLTREDMTDMHKLPKRLFAREVCAALCLSRGQISRRIKQGKFPPPVDRGKEDIFDRDDILDYLSKDTKHRNTHKNPFEAALNVVKIQD